MNTVFLLWHEGPPEVADPAMLIGVFRTEEEAKHAISLVANEPGFVDYPDGFEVCPYDLGELHWTKGFVIAKD